MNKETYVKPLVRSDVLEPDALCHTGSGSTRQMVNWYYNASCGVCCESTKPPCDGWDHR